MWQRWWWWWIAVNDMLLTIESLNELLFVREQKMEHTYFIIIVLVFSASNRNRAKSNFKANFHARKVLVTFYAFGWTMHFTREMALFDNHGTEEEIFKSLWLKMCTLHDMGKHLNLLFWCTLLTTDLYHIICIASSYYLYSK